MVTVMSKTTPLPMIGIPADVRQVGLHPFHLVGEKYINAVAHGSHVLPLLIPAWGGGRDLDPMLELIDVPDLVARLDGLFLPGSPSNVEPHHYGGEASDPDTHHDPQRDATTLALIQAAVEQAVPIFGVCRGFQEINVVLGGSLHQKVHEVSGMMDHREDKSQPREQQYAPAHDVTLSAGGVLSGLIGRSVVKVNSIHGQGIDRLAEGLIVEALAPDGLVEAFRVAGAKTFAVGVQWHPEWRYWEDELSTALFAAFGAAARQHAARRLKAAAA
jgi:putative glutamine amidotransferase